MGGMEFVDIIPACSLILLSKAKEWLSLLEITGHSPIISGLYS